MKLPSLTQAEGVVVLVAAGLVFYTLYKLKNAAGNAVSAAGAAVASAGAAAGAAVGVSDPQCCLAVANNDRVAGWIHCPGSDAGIMKWLLGGDAPSGTGSYCQGSAPALPDNFGVAGSSW